MKVAVAGILIGMAVLLVIITQVSVLQRQAHLQRCVSVLHTAADPSTPASMRNVIWTEYTTEDCP